MSMDDIHQMNLHFRSTPGSGGSKFELITVSYIR
jgi:hypothetical protein